MSTSKEIGLRKPKGKWFCGWCDKYLGKEMWPSKCGCEVGEQKIAKHILKEE